MGGIAPSPPPLPSLMRWGSGPNHPHAFLDQFIQISRSVMALNNPPATRPRVEAWVRPLNQAATASPSGSGYASANRTVLRTNHPQAPVAPKLCNEGPVPSVVPEMWDSKNNHVAHLKFVQRRVFVGFSEEWLLQEFFEIEILYDITALLL